MSTARPYFSIVTPVYDTAIDVLTETIASVVEQPWRSWELILVDDKSPDERVREYLATITDPRIVVIERKNNGGISAASNDGIAAARGEFLVLLDHDDLLGRDALGIVARVLERNTDVDYLYTDEDKIDGDGVRFDPFLKPDWSPERLRAQMYTSHLSVMRLSIARAVGGFDSSCDGSQDHDLVLKVTERARRVYHVPEILYHWRALPQSTASSGDAKPYTWDAGKRAVGNHVARIGLDATVDRGPWFGTYAVHRRLSPERSVSVVIPTRGSSGTVGGVERVFVVEAVRSLLASTRHPLLEIVVVADDDTPPAVIDTLRDIAGDRLLVVPYSEPFSFSRKCNVGVLASSGEYVVLLNDDVEVIAENIVEELCAPLAQDDVGMTGAYLVYENGAVQHAGHLYANRGYSHAFSENRLGDPGLFCALMVDREVSGLTAACVALRRDVYERVGGLSEQLAVNFNDVDLSFKLRGAGYRLVWLNRATLYHFESQSREPRVEQWEIDRIRARWGVPVRDAYLPQS
jgi:glycosyltransferase involved in cell wall biosynthesis